MRAIETRQRSRCADAARAAGLRYASDSERPGLCRRRVGPGFVYRRPDGTRVRDAATLARIRRLAIPPAWQQVWIAIDANAHLQAVGRDARGRKQYRYHPAWRAARDAEKFARLATFGRALAAIRRRVAADLRRPAHSRARVIATVVQLLERTLIRVGNDEYARANRSYGLTTLEDRHVETHGARVCFTFRAKSGVPQCIELRDPALAREIRRCQTLPGRALFQYVNGDGRPHTVDSAEVNAYLRDAAGESFSAKDFRTWAGTVLAALFLAEQPLPETVTARKRGLVAAIDRVADRLGNTRAVCRSSYVHPAVLRAFLEGETIAASPEAARRAETPGASLPPAAEAAVLAFLKRHLTRPIARAA